MWLGVGGKGHEDYVLDAAVGDLSARCDSLGIGVQDDLQEDAGIVGRGADLVVLVPKVKCGEVYFIVD